MVRSVTRGAVCGPNGAHACSSDIRRGFIHGSGFASEKQPIQSRPPIRMRGLSPSRYARCASSSRQCNSAESIAHSKPPSCCARACTLLAAPRSIAEALVNSTAPPAVVIAPSTALSAARPRAVSMALGLRSKPSTSKPHVASQFALSPAPHPQSRTVLPTLPKTPACAASTSGGCGRPKRSHGTLPS